MAVEILKRGEGLFVINTIIGGRDVSNEVMKGNVTVLYEDGDLTSMWSGNEQVMVSEYFTAIGQSLLGMTFGSISEWKRWVSENLLVKNGGHCEIVQAELDTDTWHQFDDAPCQSLTIMNDSDLDVSWHMGNDTRILLLKKNESIIVTGINNASRIWAQPIGAADGRYIHALAKY